MEKRNTSPLISFFKDFDKPLLAFVLLLCAFGVVSVYSGSSYLAQSSGLSSEYFLKRHILFCLVSLCCLFVGLFLDYSLWRKFYFPVFILCLIGLLLVSILGTNVNGAERWIRVGSLQVQPSEFMKFGLFSLLSVKLAQKKEPITDFKNDVLPLCVWPAIVEILLLKQPNFSMMMIVALALFALFAIANVAPRILITFVVVGALIATIALMQGGYRVKRVDAWLHPEKPENASIIYQQENMKIAIGSGGLFGKGPGKGTQKRIVPEPYTDGAFTVISEEFGFVGSFSILLLFLGIGYRGYSIAIHSQTRYGRYLASSLTTLILLNMLIHIAVCTGRMPNTGQVLPFISSGGTNLCVNMFFVGVLLNVSKSKTGHFCFVKEPISSYESKTLRYRYNG